MKNITLSRDTVEQWLEDLEFSDSDKNVIKAIKQALAAHDEEDIEYCNDYHCVGDCGQPHNEKEMREFLSAPTPAQPAVPDAITDKSESPEYRAGWNECRELTIQMRKS
jgi:hypothetical protein